METSVIDIPRTPVQSANLASIGYDVPRQILAVEFKNGELFEYDGVPPTVFALLETAASKGGTYIRYVRGRYPGRRIERPTAECEDCGATGPVGALCSDCGCGTYRSTSDPRPLREFFRPTRVLVNADGEAMPPARTDVQPEVIFVRDDGWSLGAPRRLAAVARQLWSDRWAQVWRKNESGQWECCWPTPHAA